ncbi:hypothetical protein POVCU2_0003790 [Plasmodium ovale curtisi]|uniref:Uncharacterized protein n=1 Tax=Plasmodium ovale curtisi TaxID=864141 RepID=A0A1A8VIB9_PLAOA|nr:hypothetical protein POVCU2_0003790 [Plasmodium ovale curtisi]SBS80856.1 hypothetical protein POVCU1_003350 [Plasmodium ovale curtisi]
MYRCLNNDNVPDQSVFVYSDRSMKEQIEKSSTLTDAYAPIVTIIPLPFRASRKEKCSILGNKKRYRNRIHKNNLQSK